MTRQKNFRVWMTALFLMTCQIVMAQSVPDLRFGVKAGGQFSKASAPQDMSSKFSGGWHAGGMARLELGRLYFQGETLLERQTMTFKSGKVEDIKYKSYAVGIPVTAGYKVWKSDAASLRIFAGGVYRYSFKGNQAVLSGVQSGLKKFDKSNIGATAGIGADFNRLTLDLRYEQGLSKYSSDFKARPQTLSLSVGFFLF